MSKKVLIISASPRKNGNSDILCEQFKKGAQEVNNDVEKIFLGDKKIHVCIGCYSCRQNGVCIYKDDMAQLLDKMKAADVIVLASPVYFYSINGQMKTFIDRCVARYTQMINKELYFILTAADTNVTNLQYSVDCFRGFAECLSGSEEKGIIYGVGAWEKGSIRNTGAMQEAYDMGKNV